MEQRLSTYLGKKVVLAPDAVKPGVSARKKQVTGFGGALTVHSPQHGAGKTLLVQSIAKELACRVHIIEAAPLLAKYGIHADAALETLVHAIVMSSAVQGQRRVLCILFDQHLQHKRSFRYKRL